MKILFLDTETTGLDPKRHTPIQISGIIEIDGKIMEEFDFLCRPFSMSEIEPEALQTNKRTEVEIRGFEDPYSVMTKLKHIFADYVDPFSRDIGQRFTIAGKNVAFDYAMMDQFFKNCGNNYWYSWVDRRALDIEGVAIMLQAAKRIKLENFKLETIAKYFDIKLEAHNSLNDIRATREIYHKFLHMIS